MKYASLIIFAAALIWTWSLVHTNSPIPHEAHSSIQLKLAELIVSTIKAKRPNATDVVVDKIWTEVISPEELKAVFVYSFKDTSGEAGLVSSRIEGEGRLKKEGQDAEGNDRWVFMDDPKTTTDSIQFDEPTVITASPDESAEAVQSSAPEHTTPTETTPATTAPEAKKEGN